MNFVACFHTIHDGHVDVQDNYIKVKLVVFENHLVRLKTVLHYFNLEVGRQGLFKGVKYKIMVISY